MSIVDKHYSKAMAIWKKYRRKGWLDEHLRGNTRGKKASKEAFMAGYMCAVVDNLRAILDKEEQDERL
jgi:hypothetical protein